MQIDINENIEALFEQVKEEAEDPRLADAALEERVENIILDLHQQNRARDLQDELNPGEGVAEQIAAADAEGGGE